LKESPYGFFEAGNNCSFVTCHWGLDFKVKNKKEKKMMEFYGADDTHGFFPG
jgi:hypothetical protein